MTLNELSSLLQQKTDIQEGSRTGFWQIRHQETNLVVLVDEEHNRLRLMSPVVSAKSLKKAEWTALMEANFDRMTDVRYSLFDEYIWALFSHPLSTLDKDLFMSALDQVCNAKHNYGTTYQSSDLIFGAFH